MNLTSRLVFGGLTAAPLALLLTAGAPMSAAHALTCKAPVTGGVGRNLIKSIAQRNARIKWRAKVNLTPGLGLPFSNWDKAKDRHYNCGQYGTLYKKWGCTATARPCK